MRFLFVRQFDCLIATQIENRRRKKQWNKTICIFIQFEINKRHSIKCLHFKLFTSFLFCCQFALVFGVVLIDTIKPFVLFWSMRLHNTKYHFFLFFSPNAVCILWLWNEILLEFFVWLSFDLDRQGKVNRNIGREWEDKRNMNKMND